MLAPDVGSGLTAQGSIVVLGIGNPLLSDDGAGIAALDMLERERELPPGVRLIDGGTVAPDLLGAVAGCKSLIVLDAVDVGEAPGQIVRMELGTAVILAGPRTVHDLGLTGLLSDLRLLGEFPDRAVLLGIQPERVALGTTLSPPVAQALERFVGTVLQQLREWTPRDDPSTGNADVQRTEDHR